MKNVNSTPARCVTHEAATIGRAQLPLRPDLFTDARHTNVMKGARTAVSAQIPNPGITRTRLSARRTSAATTIAVLFAFLIFNFKLSATSVVSGTTRNAYGLPTSTNVLIHPKSTPLVFGTNIIWSADTNVWSDTNGNYSVNLYPGDYTVTIGGNRHDTFPITVTNDNVTYRMENIITGDLTFTSTLPPIYELKNNKDQPNGYAGLDGSALISQSEIPPSITSGAIAANNATSANTPNTIVKRDSSGTVNATTLGASTITASLVAASIFSGGTFNGNGAGLTNLSASVFRGSVPPIIGLTNTGIIGNIQVDIEGDSISATNGNGNPPPSGTGTNTWSNFIQTNQIFNKFSYSNYALPGDTAGSMTGEYPTQAHLDSNQPCVFAMLAGVNDVSIGDNSNIVTLRLSNIWAQARADGKLVIASTIWPNFSWTDDKTNQINGINGWIRSHPQYYDALAETSNMLDSDMLDHLHPSTSGALKLVTIFENAFQQLPIPVAAAALAARNAYLNAEVVSNAIYINGLSGGAIGSGGPICLGSNPSGLLGIYVYNHQAVGYSTLWPGGWAQQFDINGHSEVALLDQSGNVEFVPNSCTVSNNGFYALTGSVSAKQFLMLGNTTTGPIAAQLGPYGSAFWSSNGIVYCSIANSAGNAISTVKQIAP